MPEIFLEALHSLPQCQDLPSPRDSPQAWVSFVCASTFKPLVKLLRTSYTPWAPRPPARYVPFVVPPDAMPTVQRPFTSGGLFYCHMCDKQNVYVTTIASSLRQHMNRAHGLRSEFLPLVTMTDYKEDGSLASEQAQCELCGKHFTTRRCAIAHIREKAVKCRRATMTQLPLKSDEEQQADEAAYQAFLVERKTMTDH